MQLSLKDLFAIVAYFAVTAWSLSQGGIADPIFWLATFESVLLTAAFVYVAADKKRHRMAFLVPLPFLFCWISIASIASLSLLANIGVLFLFGLAYAFQAPWSLRRLCTVIMLCNVIVSVAGTLPGANARRNLMAMREEFPIRSLAARLQYEDDARSTEQRAALALSPGVSERLAELYAKSFFTTNYRGHWLHMFHHPEDEPFVFVRRGGVNRNAIPSPPMLRFRPLQDLPFEGTTPSDDREYWQTWDLPRTFQEERAAPQFKSLHEASEFDFLNPEGFGAILEPRVKVVGFVEHGFHYSPNELAGWPIDWTIRRVSLVSLLRFDGPRVYVLDHLPRMDQLSSANVPTRPLDAFELDALKQLRTQEDVVIDEQPTEIRMLGSLRASKQCLDCHKVQHGELLGAFSYEILQAAK